MEHGAIATIRNGGKPCSPSPVLSCPLLPLPLLSSAAMAEDSAPKSIAERIAALQKQQGHGAPIPKPQQPPNKTSGHIADLQKTVEPAFFSSREKAMEERAKRRDDVDGAQEEEVAEEKPKKAFKPPPGAVQVMLPQFAAKQKSDESD
jgi:hypothetical protein